MIRTHIQRIKLDFKKAETDSSLQNATRVKIREPLISPDDTLLAFQHGWVLSALKSVFKTHVSFLTIPNTLIFSS